MNRISFVLVFLNLFVFIFLLNIQANETPGLLSDSEIYKELGFITCKIRSRFNIKVVSFGLSSKSKDNNVDEINLGFECSEKIETIDEYRELIINVLDTLVYEINSSEKFKLGLGNYPFPKESIELVVFFRDKNNETVYHPLISTVSVYEGKVKYRTVSKDDVFKYKSIITETEQEAREKVKADSIDENQGQKEL